MDRIKRFFSSKSKSQSEPVSAGKSAGGLSDGKVAEKKSSNIFDEWQKENKKALKLVLLGNGESGKSTFKKQMKIIQLKSRVTDEEIASTKDVIRNHLKDSILALVEAMVLLKIPLSESNNTSAFQFILDEAKKKDFEFSQEFYDNVLSLWSDGGLQECYKRSQEYQLMDSAKYYLDKVTEIRKRDYHPSVQDFLRARRANRSAEILKVPVTQSSNDLNFFVIEARGEDEERLKWPQIFPYAKAVLFVVDCSCYDLTDRGETNKNRLVETVEVFHQVCCSKYLANGNMFLFLNKTDILEEKIKQGRAFDSFVDGIDGNQPYCNFIRTWNTWDGPTLDQQKEFIDAYPEITKETTQTGGSKFSSRGSSFRRKTTMMQLMTRKGISPNTIKTAVFLKKLFQHIHESSAGKDGKNSCALQTFYSCAVDTNTMKTLFNSWKNVITIDILNSS